MVIFGADVWQFARWTYITVFDCLIEGNLVVTSVYVVWSLQMSLKSKVVVVGAFACRIAYVFLFFSILISHLPHSMSS